MSTLHDQDHYLALEVARNASPQEIERAYRVARETYNSDSLALYSVFGARDAQVIRERIDEAFRVLSDADSRRDYDVSIAVAADYEDEDASEYGRRALVDAAQVPDGSDDGYPRGDGGDSSLDSASAEMLGGVSDSFRELESDVEEESGDFDGAKLRRARLRRGFELDQIADITKVNIRILRQLEEENFEDLPATVYVRGFLSAYARTIGLDPARVVSSYVPRVETARSSQSRSGFRGRR